MDRRGAYFYVIDAFVASIIIVTGVIMLTAQYSSKPSSTQTFYTAEDFLTTLETTKVVDYNDPQVVSWRSSGVVDGDLTLLQQLATFSAGNQQQQGDFTVFAGILAASVPKQININITAITVVNGNLTYASASDAAEATSIVSAKRIVLLRRSPSDTSPPIVIEVRTWQ